MKKISTLVALAAVVGASSGVQAAFFGITDNNQTTTVGLNDFEGGFRIDGNTVQSGLNNGVNVGLTEGVTHTFNGDWKTGALVLPDTASVYVLDSNNLVRDILNFTYSASGVVIGGHITGDITWYQNGTSLSVPAGAITWHESDGAYGFSNGNIQALLTSTTPVPEPSTYIAGALLLLPFGVSTLRRLRSSQIA